MLRLLAGLVAAFIVGGLAAMPFTSSRVAAQDEASNEDTVCCDATAQYDTLQFATRADCRSRNGVVVEDNKCEPDKDIVCCDATAQYDTLEFDTRASCRSRNGVVVANNRCEPKDDDGAIAERAPLPRGEAGSAARKAWCYDINVDCISDGSDRCSSDYPEDAEGYNQCFGSAKETCDNEFWKCYLRTNLTIEGDYPLPEELPTEVSPQPIED